MAKITERIIEGLGGVTPARMNEAIKTAVSETAARAYEAGYSDGNDEPPSGTLKSYGYRQLTPGLRDFSTMSFDDILETVWTLWQSSPVAKRVLTLKRDYIIGHNAKPQTKNEDLKAILDDFWRRNKLGPTDKKSRGGRRAGEFTLQLFLLGEQCFPVFVRTSDGRVSLGYIDPKEVNSVINHPENSMEQWAVALKPDTGTANVRCYRIIREDEDYVIEKNGQRQVRPARYPGKLVTHEQVELQPWELEMLKEYGLTQYTGSCFFEKVNSLSNQSRGVSDLTQVADWIDQADETLFALAEREQFAGYFAFDVTLTGADDTAVAARSKSIRANPPKRGSVNVHNDSEVWQMWAPDLKQAGSISTFIALLTLIMGGVGFPLAWYGYGDDTNRSTLERQADPTEKTLEHDQEIVTGLFMTMLQFASDQAEIAGKFKPRKEDDTAVDITMPTISQINLKEIVSIFQPLITALMVAQDGKIISRETTAKAWQRAMAEFGIDYDPKQELEDADKAEMDKQEKDGQEMNDKLVGAMNKNEAAQVAWLAVLEELQESGSITENTAAVFRDSVDKVRADNLADMAVMLKIVNGQNGSGVGG